MLRPKTKRKYLRIIVLRCKKYCSVKDIAKRFGNTEKHIRSVLRRPDLRGYVNRLEPATKNYIRYRQELFAKMIRKMESGRYLEKPKRKKQFRTMKSFIRNLFLQKRQQKNERQ